MTTPPKAGADTIIPERAPGLGVAMRYFSAGLLFLAALLGVAIWKAPMLVNDYLHNPATLMLTHLFTLGFGGTVVTGAVYQMAPVLLYSRLRSEMAANVHLGLHVVGVCAMVLGFLWADTIWVATGGTLVALGGVLFLVNMVPTFRAVERWNWHGAWMAAAVLYYAITLSWGLTMAFNQRYGFIGEVEGAWLSSHLALGLGGWFSLMIIGVGLKLVPMFAPAKSLPPNFVAGTGGALATAVLLIFAGLFLSRVLVGVGLAVAVAALIAYVGGIVYAFRHRRPGPLDFSVRYAVTAGGALILSLAVAVPGLLGIWSSRPLNAGLTLFVALAFIGGTIMGMLLRIIPFMVWLHRFRNRTHKLEKIPFLHEMSQPRFGWTTYWTWFPGTLVMAVGLSLKLAPVLALGAAVVLAGLVAYAWAIRQVLYHVPPGTPALFPGKKA